MSLAISRADLKSYFNSGDIPIEAHFHALIDAMPMIYKETTSIVKDTGLTVTHGNASKASIVQVLDSDGEQVEVSWKHVSGNETNAVEITSAFAITNAQINVLC